MSTVTDQPPGLLHAWCRSVCMQAWRDAGGCRSPAGLAYSPSIMPTGMTDWSDAMRTDAECEATAPNLLCGFLHIKADDTLSTAFKATSQAFFVIRCAHWFHAPPAARRCALRHPILRWLHPCVVSASCISTARARRHVDSTCQSRRGEGKTLSSHGAVHWNQGDLFVFPMFHEGQSADHTAGKDGAALYFVRPRTFR